MSFKMGDKVQIKGDLIIGKDYGSKRFFNSMNPLKNQIAIITGVHGESIVFYSLDIDDKNNSWSDEMLEGLVGEGSWLDYFDKDNVIEENKPTIIEPKTLLNFDKHNELIKFLIQELQNSDDAKWEDISYYISALRPDLAKLLPLS